MSRPLLSILTPTFNAESCISQCLENVISQGFTDLEHLVVDGKSTDSTSDLVRDLAASHPHIRLISEDDGGQFDALNKGIRQARGSIIGLLNADSFVASETALHGGSDSPQIHRRTHN